MNHEKMDFGDFKGRTMEAGTYIVRELEAHIFKEDNILYQMALQVLSEEEWADIRRKCDEIGYCCFTPKVNKAADDANEVRE